MCDEKIQSLIERNRNYFYTSEDTQDGKTIKNLIEKDCKAERIKRKLKKAQDNLIKLKTAEDKLLMEIRKICDFEIDSVLYQESDGFVVEVEGESCVSDNYSISDIIELYIRLQRKITIENLLGLPF